jgi:hypothetical protein
MPKLDEFVNALNKLKGPAEEAGSKLSKVVDLVSIPQKKLAQKAAELSGLKPQGTSEENFYNLVAKGSDKLGLGNDPMSNMGKALAVAALEVGADPLGFLPVGKLKNAGKGLKSALKVTEESNNALKLAKAIEGLDNIGEGARRVMGTDKLIQPIKAIEETKTGQKLMAAKAEQELGQAQAASRAEAKKLENVISLDDKRELFKRETVKKDAAQFARDSLDAEAKQKGLKSRAELPQDYVQERARNLISHYFNQNIGK